MQNVLDAVVLAVKSMSKDEILHRMQHTQNVVFVGMIIQDEADEQDVGNTLE